MNKGRISNPIESKNISELMKNVIVYVEVRTEEDNRSEGIKKVISSLGAKVNNRLTKTTTHVIFKDGLLSTYKKAKQLNIPLVSILWVEACKKNLELMDPTFFPISNIDRYEYPEMYDKFKRVKSMQPDAVDHKKRNIKVSQKNNLKSVQSPAITKIKPPRIPRTPKDNLNNILSEFQDKIMSTPDNDESFFFKSKLLQKIQNSPFTQVAPNSKKNESSSKESDQDISVSETSNSLRESFRIKKPNTRYINDKFISQTEKDKKKPNRRKTIATSLSQSNLNGKNNILSYYTPLRENNLDATNLPYVDDFKTPEVLNAVKEPTKDQNSNTVSVENQSKVCYEEFAEQSDICTPISRAKNIIHRRTLYTPQNMEISSQSQFDSAKNPCKTRRRTLFDMSLDIIDQGLKNINQQSAKKKNKTVFENSSINDQTNQSRIEELSKNSTSSAIEQESTFGHKKRKLFMPDKFELTPVAEFNKSLLSSTKRTRDTENSFLLKSCDKKRRTTINGLVSNLSKENRRSSFDFDKIEKNHSIVTAKINLKPKTTNVLVCTNMHREQLEFIQKAVKSLGNFEIEPNVTYRTTHVVSLECRRTINIIKGIIRGLWILKYEWIVNSFNKGKWLLEETYELREFSRAVQICRSERQAFGSSYKMEIFTDLGSIYVSNKSKVPVDSLKDIIQLCSGHLVNEPNDCKYIIGEYYEGKVCLQPQWILDCITNNKIMKFAKYLVIKEN